LSMLNSALFVIGKTRLILNSCTANKG